MLFLFNVTSRVLTNVDYKRI